MPHHAVVRCGRAAAHAVRAAAGARSMSVLSAEQVSGFREDGFLVLERHWSAETCAELKREIDTALLPTLLRAETEDGEAGDRIFTTNEQERHTSAYFVDSAREIRPFLEEEQPEKERRVAVNKVGHALHDFNAVFRKHTYTQEHYDMARELGMAHPVAVQSMYIFKGPEVGGKVDMHRDGAFLATEPASCIGFWWALEDCEIGNGCLYAVPGSHTAGVQRRFRRREHSAECFFDGEDVIPMRDDLEGAVPLEVPAGTLVLLNHALAHASDKNTSATSRHAYSVHVVDAACQWLDNWIQPTHEKPFRTMASLGSDTTEFGLAGVERFDPT